jgi:pimeloyl-ACP methyl ester carboxylesterase
MSDAPTRRALPLILIRGFGGLGVEDERRIAYQGFNDGTVYPGKQGENYIYEGLVLRFMKSHWQYQDATNVIGYYSDKIDVDPQVPATLTWLKSEMFKGSKVVIDAAMAAALRRTAPEPSRTLWVFRYYDLNDRTFGTYGEMLVRLIELIREVTAKDGAGERTKVNVIAHSMGGLIVREALQRTYPGLGLDPAKFVNKVVTLGTPHRGISFQLLKNWIGISAAEDLEHFNPAFQADPTNQVSYLNLEKHFPPARLLTVVGTNYKTYSVGASTLANRLFAWEGESGTNYNRSDGLVKQTSAQISGAPRTFVHKCHGGFDSLVTSREAFEIATRFFFGNLRARLRFVKGRITRGQDWFGKSEFFLGVAIKPRRVDFDLFHQSAEAENCYGPFRTDDLTDAKVQFPWADGDAGGKLIWEGHLDTSRILADASISPKDLVLRLDFYVGERDLLGIGFSDNVIFRKQYYVRALLEPPVRIFLHTDETFARDGFVPDPKDELKGTNTGWAIEVGVPGNGFQGTFQIEVDEVPEDGDCRPLPIAAPAAPPKTV